MGDPRSAPRRRAPGTRTPVRVRKGPSSVGSTHSFTITVTSLAMLLPLALVCLVTSTWQLGNTVGEWAPLQLMFCSVYSTPSTEI